MAYRLAVQPLELHHVFARTHPFCPPIPHKRPHGVLYAVLKLRPQVGLKALQKDMEPILLG